MDFHFVKKFFGATALLASASLHAQTVPVEQFGFTAVNSNGNALYNVTVTPNTPATTGARAAGICGSLALAQCSSPFTTYL